tara:strand:- start:206 stop:1453 length:1248 start_codon:yes stop_codon:yes gene_type:complete
MAAPTFVVQIHLNGSFRAVTADVRAIKIDVGRQRILDTFSAGTCRIALNNEDAKYGPLSGGTYSSAQWINSEVRVLVYLNSASQPTPLFRGLCDDIDVLYPDSASSVVMVKASDGLSRLARTELVDDINGVTGNATFAEQVGSARFTAVLDNAQVDYPDESSPLDRAVDTSTVTMAAETVERLQTATYLARLAQSEDGAIYCRHGIPGGAAASAANRGNVLTYKERLAASTPTGLTFGGSSPIAEAQRPDFTKTTTQYGSELLYTRGIYAGSTGDDQTYDENVIGQPAFGIRTIVRRNLLNLNNNDVKKACTNFVALHSTPVLRIASMDCKPRAMTEAQAEKVAKLGVWDGISVRFQPAGASVVLQETVRVEGVRHDITPGDWTMRVTTSGSGASQFFILDSAIDGLLDENKLTP